MPEPLPNEHRVSRYCSPSTVGTHGIPTTAAFRPRSHESYLSVNWLEYFCFTEIGTAIQHVGNAFRAKSFTIRPKGRFAVLNVGAAKKMIADTLGTKSSIDHLPEPNDPSHAGIFGYGSEDLAVAVELRALVRSDDVFAVPD